MKRIIVLSILLLASLVASAQVNYARIFQSWGFIGDSLCSGEMECYVQGREKVSYVDMYEYSWGQHLCRLTGSEGWNFSRGGQTAQGWLEDLNSQRGWGYAQSHPKQAYIIALGVNDFSKASKGKDGITLESYAKAMETIVANLQSIQPAARIFVLTRPNEPRHNGAYEPWNDVVRRLPDKFKHVFVIDMYRDAPVYDEAFKEKYYLNGHMSPAGYLWTANYLMDAISGIVEGNPDEFRDIALIGTPFHASKEGNTSIIQPLEGEHWWGAIVNKGYAQPYTNFGGRDNYYLDDKNRPAGPTNDIPFDLATMSVKGVTSPLLLSNKGRYVWSDRPYSFRFIDGALEITSSYEKVEPVVAGTTLKDAYADACAKHFPFDGREPAELMFTMPQFNNWIETVVLGINQENAETFVDKLHESGFPCGVVMIDGGWQRYHGCRDFNPDTFPEPTRLFDKIHDYGYKGVLWVSYFLSADSRPEFVNYKPEAQNILVRSKYSSKDPALVWWWNGISVTMDLTREDIRKKFTDELLTMAERFHFDGYKFDGGDPEYFRGDGVFSEPWMTAAEFGRAYNQVGESFPYNEYRAGYNSGGKPLVLRHYDVGHDWEQFQAVIPNLTLAGLLGYPYVFPDMIGGGLATSYLPGAAFSHKMFIRSCQLQALMPMMQFSAAPWRVLTPEECEICRKLANLHVQFGPYIMEQVHHASATGEPIMRTMEYEFPGCGYEKVNQQFMLGPKYLVAPVTNEDDSKLIYLPAGKWRDDQGKVWRGPKVLDLKDIPLERLPYFERIGK